MVAKEDIPGITAIADYDPSVPKCRLLKVNLPGKKIDSFIPYSAVEGKTVADMVVQQALYRNNASVFPVIIERNNENPSETIRKPDQILNDRLRNSALAVCTQPPGEMILGASSWEIQFPSPVTPDHFVALLVPQQYLPDAELAFSSRKIPIYGVADKIAKFFPSSKKQARQLTVPDYESRILELLSASSKPLFLHGIRLPAQQDISELVSPK